MLQNLVLEAHAVSRLIASLNCLATLSVALGVSLGSIHLRAGLQPVVDLGAAPQVVDMARLLHSSVTRTLVGALVGAVLALVAFMLTGRRRSAQD